MAATAIQSKTADGATTTASIEDVRNAFGEYLDRAWDGERVIITRFQKDGGVRLIGWRDYESLKRGRRAKETRVGANEARDTISPLVARAREGERIVVTRNGKDRAVFLGERQFEQLAGGE